MRVTETCQGHARLDGLNGRIIALYAREMPVRAGGDRRCPRWPPALEAARIAIAHWQLDRAARLLLARPHDPSLDIEPVIT
jgi:hypothetical protein